VYINPPVHLFDFLFEISENLRLVFLGLTPSCCPISSGKTLKAMNIQVLEHKLTATVTHRHLR